MLKCGRQEQKRLSGLQVDRRLRTTREIAGALRGCRHVRDQRAPFPTSCALIIGEEEGAVLPDWPAQRETELISLIPGCRLLTRGESVARVQLRIAEELPQGPMQFIAAGVQHHVDLTSGITTERC